MSEELAQMRQELYPFSSVNFVSAPVLPLTKPARLQTNKRFECFTDKRLAKFETKSKLFSWRTLHEVARRAFVFTGRGLSPSVNLSRSPNTKVSVAKLTTFSLF